MVPASRTPTDNTAGRTRFGHARCPYDPSGGVSRDGDVLRVHPACLIKLGIF